MTILPPSVITIISMGRDLKALGLPSSFAGKGRPQHHDKRIKCRCSFGKRLLRFREMLKLPTDIASLVKESFRISGDSFTLGISELNVAGDLADSIVRIRICAKPRDRSI